MTASAGFSSPPLIFRSSPCYSNKFLEIVVFRSRLVPLPLVFRMPILKMEFSKLSIYPRFLEVNKELVEIEKSLKDKEKAFDAAIELHKQLQDDLRGQFTSMELLFTTEQVMQDEKATVKPIRKMTDRGGLTLLEIIFEQLDLNKKIQNYEGQLPNTEEEICLLKRDRREVWSRLRDIAIQVQTEGEGSTIVRDVHQYRFMTKYLNGMNIEIDGESKDMMEIVKFISGSPKQPPPSPRPFNH
ncbi:hypothetical protein CCACVL1_22210 [Corchorus capsularis]|uniref:Uncharacterized protein n=1 Tax=Corchorus capsularis TaxID=210143 RepID=A0A1R3H0M0_COCAP|nr:hypothetical protein CCACVL1_22210 [Corchorus capsularis]